MVLTPKRGWISVEGIKYQGFISTKIDMLTKPEIMNQNIMYTTMTT